MTRGHPRIGTISPKNGRYLGVPVRWYDWDGSQLCVGSEANICLYMCCTCIKLDTSLHCYLWLCCYAHLFLITYIYIYIHLRVSCSCKEDQRSRACLIKLCASIAVGPVNFLTDLQVTHKGVTKKNGGEDLLAIVGCRSSPLPHLICSLVKSLHNGYIIIPWCENLW